MRNSCITHPPGDRMIIIRQWQVEACDGDHCAAALLSFFEYWHNIKIEQSQKATEQNDIAESHGDVGTQDTSQYQFHTTEQLEEGMCGLYGESKISRALKILYAKGFVSVHKNPNPRYVFDKTRYFLFHPDTVNSRNRTVKKEESSLQMTAPSRQMTGAITEITAENKTRDLAISSLTPQKHQQAKRGRVQRGGKTSLPSDFEITERMLAWATSAFPAIDLFRTTEQWKDAVQAKGMQYVDWEAAWRNGIRNAVDWHKAPLKPVPPPPRVRRVVL